MPACVILSLIKEKKSEGVESAQTPLDFQGFLSSVIGNTDENTGMSSEEALGQVVKVFDVASGGGRFIFQFWQWLWQNP